MSRSRIGHRRILADDDAAPTPQIAPMINVIIVMVAFFAGGSALGTFEQHLGLKLPTFLFERASTVDRPLVVDLLVNGRCRLGGRELTSAELGERLASLKPALVLIRPEPATPHETVMGALESCSEAGVGRVQFAPLR
ncbi:MAG: biopolymer transporter ExbD [Candidatus Methylacidiphilales bacterium]|nr:biopolymer transporter ExbD [Candidatus Methylacidiphilales bacterium]